MQWYVQEDSADLYSTRSFSNTSILLDLLVAGDTSIPDDNVDGGKIFLDFDPPADYVYDMGFLDIDYEAELKVEYGNGSSKTIPLPQLGDNAYVEVDVNLSDVRRITIDVSRSGALAFIRFRPGSPAVVPRIDTTIDIPFNAISVVGVATCFDPVAWCDIQVFDILMDALDQDNDLTPEQFDVFLNGLQALYCDGAASAVAALYGIIYGEGRFFLSGLGGTVDRINLNVDMNTATLALADVDASAVAYADVYAYAFAREQDCSKYRTNDLKFKLCALAKGEAQSDAVAKATSYASASSGASASTSTGVSVMVEAERINKFDAQVNSGASSFVAANANAAASAFAAAYAEALAKIKVSTKIQEYHRCRHKSRSKSKKCLFKGRCDWHYDWKCSGHCGWWTTEFSDKFKAKAEAISSEIEDSFASALAESFASIDVDMRMRAYFEDANPDIVFFSSGSSVAIDAALQCYVK